VENRSGERGDQGYSAVPKGLRERSSFRLSGHPERDDGAEFTVHLKVGYKTVLLAVVIFDLVHLSIREIYSTSWVEHLLGL